MKKRERERERDKINRFRKNKWSVNDQNTHTHIYKQIEAFEPGRVRHLAILSSYLSNEKAFWLIADGGSIKWRRTTHRTIKTKQSDNKSEAMWMKG